MGCAFKNNHPPVTGQLKAGIQWVAINRSGLIIGKADQDPMGLRLHQEFFRMGYRGRPSCRLPIIGFKEKLPSRFYELEIVT